MSIIQRKNLLGGNFPSDTINVPTTVPFPSPVITSGNQAGTTIVMHNYSDFDLIINFPIENWLDILPAGVRNFTHTIIAGEISFTYASNFGEQQGIEEMLLITYYLPTEKPPIIAREHIPRLLQEQTNNAITTGTMVVGNSIGLTNVPVPNDMPDFTDCVVYVYDLLVTHDPSTNVPAWSKWYLYADTTSNGQSGLLIFTLGTTPTINVISVGKAVALSNAKQSDGNVFINVQLVASAGNVNTGILINFHAAFTFQY